MLRKIVDYQKLNEDILNLLVDKFPDGYDESDIISFRNAKNEMIEAVEVRTEDTIYLVKVGKRLVQAMENFIDDDVDDDFDEVKLDEVDPDLDEDDEEEEIVVRKVKSHDDDDEDDDMDEADSDYDEEDEDDDID